MKVNEIFESIQGEGSYAGYPVLFIRLSGCNLNCDFCDTKYHREGEEYTAEEIVDKINNSNKKIIVWTGGEPLLQKKEIYQIINLTNDNKQHHLETNGILLDDEVFDIFNYVCCSPKRIEDAKKNYDLFGLHPNGDVKIVTDLDKLNIDMLEYATMLMPLTTYNKDKDKLIERAVWNYCQNNNIRFSLRQHYVVWGSKKGI